MKPRTEAPTRHDHDVDLSSLHLDRSSGEIHPLRVSIKLSDVQVNQITSRNNIETN